MKKLITLFLVFLMVVMPLMIFTGCQTPQAGSENQEGNQPPSTPDIPDEPDAPNTPDIPDEPDIPDAPDLPDSPNVPDAPDLPDSPDVPDEPDIPDEPDVPGIPEDPNEPNVPDVHDSRSVVLYVANNQLSYVDSLKANLSKQIKNFKVVSGSANFSTVFSSSHTQLVIVAGVEAMPYAAQNAMQSYLNDRGRVLLLGGPAFQKPLQWQGTPVTPDDYIANVFNDLDRQHKQVLVDGQGVTSLHGVSDNKSGALTQKVGNYGLGGNTLQRCLTVENLSNWATFQANVYVTLEDANVISFYAKAGDDLTGAVSLEIVESNGARWRAKVPLSSTDWTHHAFVAEDFQYYRDGIRSSAPDFTKISKVKISYEVNFLKLLQGYHSCYISDIVLCNVEDETIFKSSATSSYNLNGVSPLYEQYPLTNAADISADEGQIFVSDRNYVIPRGTNALVSRHPGITAAGFNKDTDVRFIPLLTVTDAKGLFSGYAAWIDLYVSHTPANGKREGSMVGYFGATTDEFYNADGIAAVTETAVAMMRNAFIVDAGTTEHTYIKNETSSITAGVKYVLLNDSDNSQVSAKVALYRGDRLLAEYSSDTKPTSSFQNSIRAMLEAYNLSKGTPDRVVATLLVNGQVIDRVEQSIHYWEPKPIGERSYIYTEDGYFKKDGKIINFFGINYFPSYLGAGVDGATKETLAQYTSTYKSFHSKGGYNPTVIINDLKRLKDIGMNAVAIQASAEHIKSSNNLLDFLRICEELGIYVDVSLTSVAYPLKNYSASTVQTMIQKLHLHENDNIIAFDIAWEPRVGNYLGGGRGASNGRHIGRKNWDDDFTEWVKVQYGSIAAAEAAWGTKVDRTNSGHLLITDAMIDSTAPQYRKVIAAYYRFVDDIVSTTIEKNLSHIQSLAPDQLISFRMSMSGSARRTSNYTPSVYCFDFQSLSSSIDFMQPEGYELDASEDACLQVMFANAYARYAKPDSPVVWKEFGKSVWPYREDGNFNPSEASIAATAAYYDYVLDYCLKSYTSGMFCWYSIPGYRVGEDSDYGVFNPDGSDRGEITALLRKYAPKFINQGERKDTVYIAVERDDYVGGLFGMFDAVKNKLSSAYRAGKHVTFIDKSQNADGSYAYADTLLDEYVADAVSSTTGIAPLRYVNGIVKDFTTTTKSGKTYAQITICNTKQSIWRAGTVSLVSTDGSDVMLNYTFDKDVGYLEDVTFEIELIGKGDLALRFEVENVPFGPLYTATVK